MALHPETGLSHIPTPVPKHAPFQSIYRENFEVVQERRGRLTLYPHTEQLPLLLRALNLEFYGKLPDRIARVDHRGDGFNKLVLHYSAMMFCQHFNRTRADRLRLFDLPDANLVSRISIVQQITEEHPRGLAHRFRFYTGPDFFPEIRLSGRRLEFADHVLQRFSARVPNHIGEDLSNFLEIFYGHAQISLPCGSGRAFVMPYNSSILAFPYREDTPGEYFVATCLTPNEMNHLTPEMPSCVHNFHYQPEYVSPTRRHWLPAQKMLEIYACWVKKAPLIEPQKRRDVFKWDHNFGLIMRQAITLQGYGPGSTILFQDNVVGPHIARLGPGKQENLRDEMAICKAGEPDYDWDAAFARRDAILRGPHQAAQPASTPAPPATSGK
jgi:hypothetical protein